MIVEVEVDSTSKVNVVAGSVVCLAAGGGCVTELLIYLDTFLHVTLGV
jgi:hypothetical protein